MTSIPPIQWSDTPNDKQHLKEEQVDNSLPTNSPETPPYDTRTDSTSTLQILRELDKKIDKLSRDLIRVNWLQTSNNFSRRHAVFKNQPNSRRPQTRTCFRCHNRGHLQKDCKSSLKTKWSHINPSQTEKQT